MANDGITNYICHIWNNRKKERTYFREGGVHLDVFQTYINDFIQEYIENCDNEDMIYMVSVISNKDPELIVSLTGSDERDMREHRAREALNNKMLKDLMPQPTINTKLRIKPRNI